MAKRMFVRRSGFLEDHYENDQGLHVDVQIRVAESEQAAEAPAVERLLAALKRGESDAPGNLVDFADHPEVRAALLDEARRSPAESLANVAQAVTAIGGSDVIDVLGERLEQLLEDSTTFEDDPFFNWKAGSLTTVAAGLARLDARTDLVIKTLGRLLAHPCAGNRNTAAAALADVAPRLSAEWRKRVLDMLGKLLKSDDPAVFACVAPAFATIDEPAVFGRCEALLTHRDSAAREMAVAVLEKLDHPRAVDVLVRQLPKEPSLRLAARIATHLGASVGGEARIAVARRVLADESPSLRLEAAAILSNLGTKEARTLAREASGDEPDECVRAQLIRAASAS